MEQSIINRLNSGLLLDKSSNSILEKDSMIVYNDEMPKFELLRPGTSHLFKTETQTTVERVNVTKGIRRKQSIALGFQRTNFSPKEIFKSVRLLIIYFIIIYYLF